MSRTTLYRAVTSVELNDLVVTGEYRSGIGSVEGKYFFDSADDAVKFTRKMFGLFPDEGPYTITSITISELFLKSCVRLAIAGEGGVWYLPESALPFGPVDVWTYCPWGESL